MDTPQIDYEFYSEVEDPDAKLEREARERLDKLAEGHTDIVGASIAVDLPVEGETPFLHRARVVVYMRPENVVAVEKADTAVAALKGALSAVERQVRERRDKLRDRWKQP